MTAAIADSSEGARHGGLLGLAIGAIGVVYGDIGTSPLYAIDQLFVGPAGLAPTPDSAVGAISLAIWTLTLIVAVKYAALVLNAENEGEGGVFALYGLLHKYKGEGASVVLWALMLGAGLLFGDGMITPAISVLSAVEGLQVATPALKPFVIPATIALLALLFLIQHRGASSVGRVFGPVLLLWFVVIALLGAAEIAREPKILVAFNPLFGLEFLFRAGFREALLILGAMMLVVTGGEAMYADLGHFGARPIRVGWFMVVYPALILNYLGQGAYLIGGEAIVGGKLFYALCPDAFILPLVALATLATVIASQALISGAFSLTSQAVGLGLFPRLSIAHTHRDHAGQIYVPLVNWALLVGCVALVLGFGSSSALAAAYGLAVAGVMLATSIAMIVVARRDWSWSPTLTSLVWGPLTALNGAFLVASSLKFMEGGFVPVSIGLLAFALMGTWRWGRKATFAAYAARSTMTMADLVHLHRSASAHIDRIGVLMSPHPVRHPKDRAPALVSLLIDRDGLLPKNLLFVEVTHPKVPHVRENRYHVTVFDRRETGESVIGVELRFGFMEEPSVERFLEELARHHDVDLPTDPKRWIVHVTHENLLPARKMTAFESLRFRLFQFLRRVSRPAYSAYGLGDEVQLSVEIMPVKVR